MLILGSEVGNGSVLELLAGQSDVHLVVEYKHREAGVLHDQGQLICDQVKVVDVVESKKK